MAGPSPGPDADRALATQMAQEARLFRALYQRRRFQHAGALAEARRSAAEAASVEEKLLFAVDRAEFAREQLRRIEATAAGRALASRLPDEAAARRQQVEHDRQLEATEAALRRRQELRSELCLRRQRSALAVARLRALRGLCELGLRSEGGDTLAGTLRRCEEDLLAAGGPLAATEPLAAELEAAIPLGMAVPLLQGRKLGDVEGAAAGAGAAQSGGDEEARLRRVVAELTDEREALREELREAAEQARRPGPPVQRCTAAEVALLRRELADAYTALAEGGDPAVLEAELASLRQRRDEALSERAALAARPAEAERAAVPLAAAGAPAGGVLGGGEVPRSASELTALLARNQNEIAALRARLRAEAG